MTEQKEIKIKYEGQEVVYNVNTQKWLYAGVEENVVRFLSPARHQGITALLKKEVIEYQGHLQKEEADRKAKDLADRVKRLDAFKAEVNPLVPAGFTVRFGDPTIGHRADSFTIEKDKVGAAISVQDRVYTGARWDMGGHRATLPWLVSFSDKSHRFATLEKAINNATKNINATLDQKALQKKADTQKANLNQALEKALNDCGITMKVETSGSYGGRGRWVSSEQRIARIMIAKPDTEYSQSVGISGTVFEEKGKPVLYHVAIKGGFTPEQFKKLAEFVKTMGIKAA